MISNLFHVVLGIAGLLLLYAGLFLAENEEGKMQNRLEELWIRVDELRSRAMTRQAALLQQIAGLVAGGFAALFGRKFFSVKSVASCLCSTWLPAVWVLHCLDMGFRYQRTTYCFSLLYT
jgi:hypothetical protein